MPTVQNKSPNELRKFPIHPAIAKNILIIPPSKSSPPDPVLFASHRRKEFYLRPISTHTHTINPFIEDKENTYPHLSIYLPTHLLPYTSPTP